MIFPPFRRFAKLEAAPGLLLFSAAVLALAWSNSPLAPFYAAFKEWGFAGALGARVSLEHAVNDGLMAVFFLLVGLEIKSEVLEGELASLRRSALPVAAAVGGMLVRRAFTRS